MNRDLELYSKIRHALCCIKNTKLPVEGVKDSYALCELVEARIKELEQIITPDFDAKKIA